MTNRKQIPSLSLTLGLTVMVSLMLSGCMGTAEEYRRSIAMAQEESLSRAMNEYSNASVDRSARWQMPNQQSVDYKTQLEDHADSDIASYLQPNVSGATGRDCKRFCVNA